MFEKVRQSFREILAGATAPDERRAVLARMRDTLVRAKMGLSDLRDGVQATRARLEAERGELETVRRRRRLAEQIGDGETVAVATRYEAVHAERVAVLERKLDAQSAELALVEREVEEMTGELKAASLGIGATPPGATPEAAAARELERDGLAEDLDGLARARARAERDAEAERKLEALKRRMGK